MEKERREKVDKEIGDSSRRKRKRVRDTLSDDEDVKGDLGEDLDSHQMRKEEHEDDVEEIKREVKERYARSDFVNGDAVIVVSGDFIGLEGWIERVDDDGIFHIKPNRKDLSDTIAFTRMDELCKLFKTGDHVKVVHGACEGYTGLVIEFNKKNHTVVIFSETREEQISVLANYVSMINTTELARGGDSRFGGRSGGGERSGGGRWSGRGGRSGGGERSGGGRWSGRGGRSGRGGWSGRGGRSGGGGRGGHGNDLLGKYIKIKSGPYKGYKGRVIEVKGVTVRVELNSQMQNVTVNSDQIQITDS